MLIYGSLKADSRASRRISPENYLTLLGKWRLVPAFLNSLIFSFGASFLTFAGGLYLAWMTERTNVPGKARFTRWFCSDGRSGLLTTVGWIILFSRRTGVVNLIATQYLGFEQPLEINNMLGMIWVLGWTRSACLSFACRRFAFHGPVPGRSGDGCRLRYRAHHVAHHLARPFASHPGGLDDHVCPGD
jgi:ABC-type Fe3+ transport system permease subunit